jgi:hypothetical protein
LCWATLDSCGVDIDLVRCLFMGVGVKERRREGVTVPEGVPGACTQGAGCMNLRANCSQYRVVQRCIAMGPATAAWRGMVE